MPVSNFEEHQLRVVQELDTKYAAIMELWEKTPEKINSRKRLHALTLFFQRTLDIMHLLLNKAMTNDDFLLFRIDNVLHYEYGSDEFKFGPF